MKIDFSPNCQKALRNIKSRDSQLFERISKQLFLFQRSPNHPSLRLHKLKGNLQESWSISISSSHRMVFYYRKAEKETRAVFIFIGTHKEVYK